MGKLKIRKKFYGRPRPDPTLKDDAPCWCGSEVPYVKCHKLWDLKKDGREDQWQECSDGN